MSERILVVDDDPDIRTFLEVTLALDGFEVLQARDGEEALDLANQHLPDLVLMDVMLPRKSGIEALRHLRTDARTSHIPVILLSAKSGGSDKVQGLDAGADDYVTKPFDTDELTARVNATLRRASEMRTVSPLTGLPGNARIRAELARRIDSGEPFALLYADLNHFKAVNDHYGFMRGDDVLKAFAELVVAVARELGRRRTFVGHVGGDDFVLIAPAECAEPLAQAVCERFDAVVWDLYDPGDRERGYIEVLDRQGERRRYGPVSASVGIATSEKKSFEHPSEPVAVATEMKHYAKVTGSGRSSWAVDRRDEPTVAELEVELPLQA